MTEKKGSVVVQVLALLIVVVVTSAIILMFIKTGLLTVDVSEESGAGVEESVLNTEFIPFVREGYLAIKDFQFCSSVSQRYDCVGQKDSFGFGEAVHFRFVIESSIYQGELRLMENYRLKDPLGRVILDVDEKSNFHVDLTSQKEKEQVAFKDFFTIYPGSPAGEYTLELVMENPLLVKTAKVTRTFEMG